jgi:hypothetical protein
VLWIHTQVPYSQHFLIFSTYEYFQQAGVLDYSRPVKLSSDKHSNLLDLPITYEENKLLRMQLQGLYSQPFIFFLTYELAQ